MVVKYLACPAPTIQYPYSNSTTGSHTAEHGYHQPRKFKFAPLLHLRGVRSSTTLDTKQPNSLTASPNPNLYNPLLLMPDPDPDFHITH